MSMAHEDVYALVSDVGCPLAAGRQIVLTASLRQLSFPWSLGERNVWIVVPRCHPQALPRPCFLFTVRLLRHGSPLFGFSCRFQPSPGD